MMRLACVASLAGLMLVAGTALSEAASLQVAPVRLNIPAPAAASKLSLNNLGDTPINAQIRVFRWSMANGKESLTETRDVVASPPILKLAPHAQGTVRIVRTIKTPPQAEESYRLIVDEIPPAPNKAGMSISFVLRYSIPVFFAGAPDSDAQLSWSVNVKNGTVNITAVNRGGRHARLSNLKIKTPTGAALSFGDGLTGYVLANSTARFSRRGKLKGVTPGSDILITAQGENGPIEAQAEVHAAN